MFLPHPEFLTIVAQPAHTIFLGHLSIPAGASLKQEFDFSDDRSPIPTYLPKTFTNLKNLSPITSVNLSFNYGMFLRLDGPSGTLYAYGHWVGAGTWAPPTVDRRVLRSLTQFHIPTISYDRKAHDCTVQSLIAKKHRQISCLFNSPPRQQPPHPHVDRLRQPPLHLYLESQTILPELSYAPSWRNLSYISKTRLSSV